jgi:hypothetical protein
MEYTRKVQPTLGGGEGGSGKPGAEREMSFATVTVAEGSGADQKVGGWALKQCVSKSVVRLGPVYPAPFSLPAHFGNATCCAFNSPSHSTCVPCPGPSRLLQVNNVAELLLVRGLAQVVKHRAEEERSGAPMRACYVFCWDCSS